MESGIWGAGVGIVAANLAGNRGGRHSSAKMTMLRIGAGHRPDAGAHDAKDPGNATFG
jgi:hypothetical protein